MTINKEQPVSDAILPCDVTLPPATTICAGCKLSTLVHALELRGMESHPLEQQQPVSDAVVRVERELAYYERQGVDLADIGVAVNGADLRTIVAASHPLEQQQAVSGDVVERVAGALSEQMENEEAQSLPSSMQRERGLIWLEGWFNLRTALQGGE